MLELVLPFGIFGPRRLRLFTLAAFTLFQIANAATANYGFFCYLAVVLGVFLLDDARRRARAGPPRARRAFRAGAVRRFGARLASSPQVAAARATRPAPAPRPTMGWRSPAPRCSRSSRWPTRS